VTGAPLGSITESPIYAPPKRGEIRDDGRILSGPPLGAVRTTTVVELIERLPATPANLAKVRERRRSAVSYKTGGRGAGMMGP
jgi:hypothetical protein